jgi:hypothetical protein
MSDPQEPAEDFEEKIAALLKVDPKGLSGKHRRPETDDTDDEARQNKG